jgi:hypothetical protein
MCAVVRVWSVAQLMLACSHRHCNLVQQPAHHLCVRLHIDRCTHFMSMMFILTQRPSERRRSFVRNDPAWFLRIIFEYRSARVCRYLERSSTLYSDAIGNLGGMNVYIRNTNLCRTLGCATLFCTFNDCFSFFFFAFVAFAFFCESSFQGGSWALVRRVRQGSSWHPATDNLAGTHAAYGTYGSPTDETTFNVVFSSMVTSSTEFLFMTGKA